MHGDFSNETHRGIEPLPPVRTRWVEADPASAGPRSPLLGPVRSHLFATTPPAAPVFDTMTTREAPDVEAAALMEAVAAFEVAAALESEPAHDIFPTAGESEDGEAQFEPGGIETSPDPEAYATPDEVLAIEYASAEAESPWETAGSADDVDALTFGAESTELYEVGTDDEGVDEFVFEVAEGEEVELILETDDEGNLSLATAADDEADEGVDVPVADSAFIEPPESTVTAATFQHRPPPLSAWGIDAARTDVVADDRIARARREWESLGEALARSLEFTPGSRREVALTDELEETLRAADAMHGPIFPRMAGLQPVGARIEPGAGAASGESATAAELPPALSDFVRRIEAFAATLRTAGPDAITRAQQSDDRVAALLAGIAAGYVAGRAE